MIRIESAAASVRKVTSAQARPPSQSASASGAASLLSFKTTTGTIPYCPSFSNTSFIFVPPVILIYSWSLNKKIPGVYFIKR